MNIEQISSLTLEQSMSILLERIGEESPSQEAIEAEFELYKSELIAEANRISDLKLRFAAMSDQGLIQAQGISNPDKYFQDAVLGVEASSAESEMQALEQAYSAKHAELHADSWLKSRQVEYAKLDSMLLEGLAEAAADRPEKLQEYLEIREQIKIQFPKPE